jgi:hypothetical protein
MTAEERGVLDELGKEIPEGAQIVAGQWKLPYPEEVGHNGVSLNFYNRMLDVCFSQSLLLEIRRGNTIDGVIYFTVTIR